MSTRRPAGPGNAAAVEQDKPRKLRRKADAVNQQVAAQIRKLLGKHWANKYRHGRG
ncbi:MAG: hypothetical protein JNM48_13080 [Rhodospirillales bacterium]|nr:hypothetical protein [Rhodospirillales bacterium]